jgi:transcriptional regulator with XRE-family HTH domain
MDEVRLGLAIRALRRRRRWRQSDVAEKSGISRSAISRLERGGAECMSLADIATVARVLGAKLHLSVRWQGEALDRLLDAAHAALTDQLVRLLTQLGWEVAVEVSFSIGGERGSIDIVAARPGTRHVVVVEAKSVVPDVQATIAALDRKARLAPIVVRRLGWTASTVSRVLAVRESRTARRRIEQHQATFDSAFPLRGRKLVAWLRAPENLATSGLLLLPESRHTVVSRGRSTPPSRIRPNASVADRLPTTSNGRASG